MVAAGRRDKGSCMVAACRRGPSPPHGATAPWPKAQPCGWLPGGPQARAQPASSPPQAYAQAWLWPPLHSRSGLDQT
eukprot:11230034-Alexandrium_andersonii.AAC.1